MKYTKEITDKMVALYTVDGKTAKEIALILSKDENEASPPSLVPERSVIAKLSSLGVYKKKEYLTKRGEVPIKKEEYIERIAALLDVRSEFLESLEKVNKAVLALIATRLDAKEE